MRGAGATTIMQRWALSRSGVVGHRAGALSASAFAAWPAGAHGFGGVEGRDCETENKKKGRRGDGGGVGV